MTPDSPDAARWQARLERERTARKAAEKLLEDKSLALYEANRRLVDAADNLERQVQDRTQDLARALAQAEAATLAKSRFLAMMSHEIRTPLNGILGLGELLSLSTLDTEQRRQVATIRTSGENLLALINDILDFSKIEEGQMALETAPLSPMDTLQEVVSLLRVQAGTKGLPLRVEVGNGVPAHVQGDVHRLRQVWLNLLGNAIKFTERGEVVATLSVGSEGWLWGEVRDTGIGMPESVVAHLFQPFVQADSSTTRRFGGTGLGLVITRRLVELMGGRVDVRSVPGQGSVFRFGWPAPGCTEAVLHPTGAGDAPPLHTGLSALRVLLVEDHPVNRQLALAQLKKLGLTGVKTAADGEFALEHLRHGVFDAVLMDMQMPRLDGLATSRCLRQMPLVHQPWVIAMTANAYEEDRQACREAGMDGFLSKPVSVPALAAALEQALAQAARRGGE